MPPKKSSTPLPAKAEATTTVLPSSPKPAGKKGSKAAVADVPVATTATTTAATETKKVVVNTGELEVALTRIATLEKEIAELKAGPSSLTPAQKFDIITRGCVNEEPNTCMSLLLTYLTYLTQTIHVVMCYAFDSVKW
jgi:hypothetical protein